MARLSTEVKFIRGIVVALLVAVGSWAVFNVARIGLSTFLENNFGITSELTQSIYLAVIILVILLLLGYSFRKSIRQLIR